jgi:hypothetical protein
MATPVEALSCADGGACRPAAVVTRWTHAPSERSSDAVVGVRGRRGVHERGCGIFARINRGIPVFKKQWPAFVLAFVVPLLAVFWWWGGFSSVSVTETDAGPYRYAYIDYAGPISNMRKSQRAALDKFTAAKIEAGDTVTVILTDPRAANGKVRAQVGYILGATASVPDGMKEGRIERRPVYSATVQAAVLLAPSKAYEALADVLKARGKTLAMPTVELYRPAGQASRIGTFTLEMDR